MTAPVRGPIPEVASNNRSPFIPGKALRALTTADWRNIRRDSFLQFILVYPFILGILLRWLIPFVTDAFADRHDLTQYNDLMAAFFGLLIVPALVGVAIGFLLLDEKDDRTLTALQVTPLSPGAYLVYRLALPTVVSLISVIIVIPIMDIVAVSVYRLIPMALAAALEAPIFALLLATFANNKVQGLALMKATSITLIIPFVSWFVPEPWQWLLGFMPTFWPVKSFWLMQAGATYWPYLLLGIVFHAVVLWALIRRFHVVAYRP
jgi:fluoroquinolone transport system permease protein